MSEPPLTLTTFLACLGLAAALRHVATAKTKFCILLRIEDKDAMDSYLEAAKIHLGRLCDDPLELQDSTARIIKQNAKTRRIEHDVLYGALNQTRVILLCDTHTEIDEETQLFIDHEIRVPGVTPEQVSVALKGLGHPSSERDIKTILGASWKSLRFAFPRDRPLLNGLRRLRAIQASTPETAMGRPQSGTTLDDLHGFGAAAQWGKELARDISDFRGGRIGWDDVDAGILISGPPGTGKTMFAGALARTCDLPLVFASSAQWQATGALDDFLKAMRRSFEEARAQSPCILFIDEVDSFGDRSVAGQHADYKRQAINGFLELLDGFEKRKGVVVVGATNFPDHIDRAIKRPGRLDRHVTIPMPDADARVLILQHHSGLAVPREHHERFIRATSGMSGADISQLVRDAKRSARRRSAGLEFDDVLKFLSPLLPLPEEVIRRTCLHESGHALVGLELGVGRFEEIVVFKDVIPDTVNMLGGARFETPELEQRTRSFYLDNVALLLGGIAAETIFLGTFSDGASTGSESDLAKATEIATLVETCFGMGTTLAVEVDREHDLPGLRAESPAIRNSVTLLLDEQFKRATDILRAHRAALDAIAVELAETRHASREFVQAAIIKHQARWPCDLMMTD